MNDEFVKYFNKKSMKHFLFLFVLLLLVSCQKQAGNIIHKIAERNVLESEFVGFGESEQYKRYQTLKKTSTKKELTQLLNHENATVNTYAAMALIDKKQINPVELVTEFIKADKEVSTFSGCIASNSTILTEIYYHYWNTCFENPTADALERKIVDTEELQEMDSLLLVANKIPNHLYIPILENRVYSPILYERILELATINKNFHAMKYVHKHLKMEHKAELIASLNSYYNQEDILSFEKKAIEEMLEFK